VLSVRALATRRGSNQAPSASTQPTTICSASPIARSRRVDLEAVAAQDRVPYESGCDVAELQTEHQRPRESDAPPPAIDPTLDDLSRAVAAEEKRRRPIEPICHRRIEEPGTNHGHTDAVTLEAGPQGFGGGAQPSFACAIPRAVGQPPIGGYRCDRGDAAASARAQRRQKRLDGVDGAEQVYADLPRRCF